MVTEEDIKNKFFAEDRNGDTSLRVTAEEMRGFEENSRKLPRMIGARKIQFEKEFNNDRSSYEKFANACCLNASTVKKTIAGSIKVTRTFLYRMVVGMHMTVEEANEYFILCGGALREECIEDYICIRALEHEDSIELFIEQFEKYTKAKLLRKERDLKE